MCHLFIPFLPYTEPQATTDLILSLLQFCFFQNITYWEPYSMQPFRLASFTWQNVFKIHLYLSSFNSSVLLITEFILLYGCTMVCLPVHLQKDSLIPSVLVAQSCLTLCDPMDCGPPGSSVHGIFQARILEWVAIPFSRGSFQPRH